MKAMRTLLPAALVLSATVHAQSPSALTRITGSVETSILELDVIVTDRDGKPVSGLQSADFEVRIGGKPAAIANFYERRPESAGRGVRRSVRPGPRRWPCAGPPRCGLRATSSSSWIASSSSKSGRRTPRSTVCGPSSARRSSLPATTR